MAEVRPKIDEYWIARIKYWPDEDARIDVVLIYYPWGNGDVDFIPCGEEEPIRSTQCAQFELLERIEVEKYK